MKSILVVDDAATIRLYYRNILESAGYQVDEAINGIEGLEKALSKNHDIYIVDVNMPQMDGCTFLKEIRSSKIEQVPAIMISTEAEPIDYHLGYQVGANTYIVKPVKPQQLLAYIRCLVGDSLQ
jgi:two-component system, chemotaxis family, chemotaxis protein CheY